MGGGSSSSNWQQDKIESVKLFGGEYRDCHIIKQASTSEKSITIDECEKVLMKSGVDLKEQFKTLLTKIKLVKMGSIENVQFVIENSIFCGRYIQVQFEKSSADRYNLLVAVSRIMAVYTIPIEQMKHIRADYCDGKCYRYNVNEFQAVKNLSTSQQNNVVSMIKERIKVYKAGKWSGAGKLTILDMVQQQLFYINIYRPAYFKQILSFLKEDFIFLSYLSSNKWNKLNQFLKTYELQYQISNIVLCHRFWSDYLLIAIFQDIANQLSAFPFKNQIINTIQQKKLQPKMPYDFHMLMQDSKVNGNLMEILKKIRKNPNCMSQLKKQKANYFDWDKCTDQFQFMGSIFGQYKKREM